jgi:hypothetical protein
VVVVVVGAACDGGLAVDDAALGLLALLLVVHVVGTALAVAVGPTVAVVAEALAVHLEAARLLAVAGAVVGAPGGRALGGLSRGFHLHMHLHNTYKAKKTSAQV